ncbi:uncharacterized protein ACIBXB_004187 [Morphnus guianensis]
MATARRTHAQSAKRGRLSLPLPPTPGACAGAPSCGGRVAFCACPAVGACATRLGPAPPGPAPPVGAWPPRRTDALERVSALTAMADPTTQSPFVSSSSSSGQSQPQLGGCGAAGSAFCADPPASSSSSQPVSLFAASPGKSPPRHTFLHPPGRKMSRWGGRL